MTLQRSGMGGSILAAQGLGAQIRRKTLTFSGQTPGTINLFMCQGTNVVRIVCVCTTTVTVTGAPTLEVGVSGATAAIIAQTTADLLAEGEIWHDVTPDATIEAMSTMRDFITADSNAIALTITTATSVDEGVLEFYCLWSPLSADGSVVPAA